MKHFLFEQWFPCGESMWFVEFMQQALYHPIYGYYTTRSNVLGAQGDFITAPEMTPLFGQTLATACAPILAQCAQPTLFEFGAGSGRLCIDVLSALNALQALPERYVILEVSGQLRAMQQQAIQAAIPQLFSRVEWIDAWPTTPFNGVVLANEVLDAMPVHRLMCQDQTILESKITHSTQGELIEQWAPCIHPRLVERMLTCVPPEVSPYVSEINGLLDDWLRHCFEMLGSGAVFLIDYGFPASEYYHPDRAMGTLMCHHQHRAHVSPLIHVGEQDITAHVDFTHVAEAASDAGFDISWFTTQAAFLLDNGVLARLEHDADIAARFTMTQQVQRLLSPSEMGELFKVMVLTKRATLPYTWSHRYDQRARL